MQVVTIAARNYLPHVRVLAASALAQPSVESVVVLLVDAGPGEVDLSDLGAVRVATPGDLPLDPATFGRMALEYGVRELCTAVKPAALRMVLDGGADVACYLDPDVEVFADLDEVAALAAGHDVVLTPHRLSPPPLDDLMPDEVQLLVSGAFNLGFAAVGPRGRPLLDWWGDRLVTGAVDQPEAGLFTDQHWMDLATSYFDVAVLRDPGYNVAHWNLDERPLAGGPVGAGAPGAGPDAASGDGAAGAPAWTAAGRPLRFFHFSGYDPARPWVLASYAAAAPRCVVGDHPGLAGLLAAYGRRLAAERARVGDLPPYRFGALGGWTLSTRFRRAYREALVHALREGGELPPPGFGPGSGALEPWLREPVGPESSVTRLLDLLWYVRPDLHPAFPDHLGRDHDRFAAWAAANAVADGDLPASWLAPLRRPAPPVRAVAGRGVNVAGYLRAELGVGQMGRAVAAAAVAAGLPTTTLTTTRTANRQAEQPPPGGPGADVRYPVNVVAVNADQLPRWTTDVGPSLLRGRWNVGVWAWELEHFPEEMRGSFALVDEVWAISTFIRDALAPLTDTPVHVVPLPVPVPVDPAALAAGLDREALGLPGDRPYLLFAFDYFSDVERKNPVAVVEAFRRAFGGAAEGAGDGGTGPVLVVKAINGGRRRTDRERLRAAAAGCPDVVLVEDYLSREQTTALMAGCAAYVSLHRSEGFGLTVAEAMALGRPVVCTAYSGPLDFADADSAVLVPYDVVPVGPGRPAYPAEGVWAEPDVDAAAAAMRRVVDDPAWAAALGERGREKVRAACSLERAAAFVAGRVDAGMEALRARREAEAAAAGAAVGEAGGGPDPVAAAAGALVDRAGSRLHAARVRVHERPDPAGAQTPVVGAAARRAVSRVLAHRELDESQRFEAVLDAVAEVSGDAVRWTAAELAALRAADDADRAAADALADRLDRLEARVADLTAATASRARADAARRAREDWARRE